MVMKCSGCNEELHKKDGPEEQNLVVVVTLALMTEPNDYERIEDVDMFCPKCKVR